MAWLGLFTLCLLAVWILSKSDFSPMVVLWFTNNTQHTQLMKSPIGWLKTRSVRWTRSLWHFLKVSWDNYWQNFCTKWLPLVSWTVVGVVFTFDSFEPSFSTCTWLAVVFGFQIIVTEFASNIFHSFDRKSFLGTSQSPRDPLTVHQPIVAATASDTIGNSLAVSINQSFIYSSWSLSWTSCRLPRETSTTWL